MSMSVLLVSLLGFLWFQVLVFNPFGVYVCIWCEKMFYSYCFMYSCPILANAQTVFSPLFILVSFVVALLSRGHMGLFLGCLFFSTDLYICFCASTMPFVIQSATLCVFMGAFNH